MIQMQSKSAADVLQVRHKGKDMQFTGMQNDTRKLKGDEIYIAISGENVDGHDYIEQAFEQGASVALVEQEMDCEITQLICTDSVKAMGQLTAYWRDQFTPVLIAITGSNGKTTVKEMVASILAIKGPVLMTAGNLNNHIGVPLTLARIATEHYAAIIEMGANHQGEIAYLSQLAKPDVCLINNAAPAHLEGFGSVEGVAKCKGEIFLGLTKNGTGVINADDDYFDYWQTLLSDKKSLSFGMENSATVHGQFNSEQQPSLNFNIDNQQVEITLPLPGRHNAMNALAAAACAHAAGCDLAEIKQGLEAVKPVQGRMQKLRGFNQSQVINDSYNANPASLKAALEWLSEQQQQKILVLGDMFELGEDAPSLHQQAGQQAKQMGIDSLLGIGALGRAAVEGFGSGGHFFADYDSLIAFLKDTLDSTKVVLIKGSRGMHMETIADAVSEKG